MAKRILIVEDQANQAKVVEVILKKWGFDVETAFNGAEAIEVLDRVPLDGMTLGIRMPRMNGYEVIRYLRQRDQKMPVIIISGWVPYLDKTIERDAYLINNVQALIPKPVTIEELKPAVDRWFGMYA